MWANLLFVCLAPVDTSGVCYGFDRQDGVRLFVLSEDAGKETMTGYRYWTVHS